MRNQKERIRKHKVSGHGSTTKAGKVRGQTPKVPKSVNHSKNSFPRKANHRKYFSREKLERKVGQNWKE